VGAARKRPSPGRDRPLDCADRARRCVPECVAESHPVLIFAPPVRDGGSGAHCRYAVPGTHGYECEAESGATVSTMNRDRTRAMRTRCGLALASASSEYRREWGSRVVTQLQVAAGPLAGKSVEIQET